MSTAAQQGSRLFPTCADVKASGDWIAPIIAWVAVTAMLLAVVAILFGPAQ